MTRSPVSISKEMRSGAQPNSSLRCARAAAERQMAATARAHRGDGADDDDRMSVGRDFVEGLCNFLICREKGSTSSKRALHLVRQHHAR